MCQGGGPRRAVACFALAACTTGAFPRPAEVPAPGRFTLSVHQVAANVAPGVASVMNTPPFGGGVGVTNERRDGNAGLPTGVQASMVAWGPLVGIEARLVAGLFDPCEGAALFGLSRVAGELRCAIARTERGPPVSIAGAFGYEPFFSRDGWWARLEVDIATPGRPGSFSSARP